MKFKIGFEKEDKKKLFEYWNEILENNAWSEGKFTNKFEENWSIYNSKKSLSFSSWSGAAESVIKYYNLENETVLCPSNTFQATPMISKLNGVKIKFVDCNKNDLCISFEDMKKKADLYKPKAIWVVHIGGHIAFQINEISEYCKKNKIIAQVEFHKRYDESNLVIRDLFKSDKLGKLLYVSNHYSQKKIIAKYTKK